MLSVTTLQRSHDLQLTFDLALCLQVSCELLASHLLYRQEDLTVGETLGEGAFGVVCKGSLLVNGKAMSVAVKAIKGGRGEGEGWGDGGGYRGVSIGGRGVVVCFGREVDS